MKPLVVFILPFLNPKKVACPISCSILWIWILQSYHTLNHHEVISFLLHLLQQTVYSLVRYLWISTNATFVIINITKKYKLHGNSWNPDPYITILKCQTKEYNYRDTTQWLHSNVISATRPKEMHIWTAAILTYEFPQSGMIWIRFIFLWYSIYRCPQTNSLLSLLESPKNDNTL